MLARSRSHIEIERILTYLAGCEFTDESHVSRFEERFSQYLGVSKCYATNQGRAALLIALKALGLGNEDEIIVQSFTYLGVVDAIIESGAKPVFADNSLKDFNAGWEEIEKKITDNTKVIIATHLFGVPCEIDEIARNAAERNLIVIEDCAQCFGAHYGGKNIGTFGDMAFVSFNFEKHLTTGEGGMLIVNNTDILDAVEEVVHTYSRVPLFDEKCYVYGLIIQYIATRKDIYWDELSAYFGQDYCRKNKKLFNKMDTLVQNGASEEEIYQNISVYLRIEMMKSNAKKFIQEHDLLKNAVRKFTSMRERIQKPAEPHPQSIDQPHLRMNTPRAIVGLIGLEHLGEVNAIRNSHARMLAQTIKGNTNYLLPEISEKKNPVFLKYCILSVDGFSQTSIFQKAQKRGYELGNAQWSKPVHLTEPYNSIIPHNREELKASEFLAEHIINIPVHYYVSHDDLADIAHFLNNFHEKSLPNSI